MNNSNIYGINSVKNINNNSSTNIQMGSDEEKEKEKEKSKKINAIDDGAKKSKARRSSLILKSKLSMKNINNDDNKSVDNNSFENNNNEQSTVQIRKAPTSNMFLNLKNRKFSVISEKINNMNISEKEINDNEYGKKRLLNNNLRSSLNYRYSPRKERRIVIERNTPSKIKKKVMNESLNENVLLNKRKIIDINVSSMTVNDSNFIRDKKSSPKKKSKKYMNKYDFFM